MPDPERIGSGSSAAADTEAEPPVLHSTRLPPAATAALHDTLDDRAARTGELRDALDELRATLETPADGAAADPPGLRGRFHPRLPGRPGAAPPTVTPEPAPAATPTPAGPAAPAAAAPAPAPEPEPVPAAPPHRGRRSLVVAAVFVLVGVVAAAAVAGTAAGRDRADRSGAAARATFPATGTATGTGSGGLSPSPPAPPATHPQPWPGGAVLEPPGLPRSGPGADAPGSELTAAIDPDGRHVDVYERAVLRPGTTSVRLAPAPAAALPAVLRDLRPSVEDLQAEVDGRPVVPIAAGDGWRVAAPGGITQVVLRYRLGGAFARQEPAPPGRASLLLRPLTGPAVQAAADPVVVRIDDRGVDALYCPSPRPALCSASAGTQLTATVPPGADAVVLAQVTL